MLRRSAHVRAHATVVVLAIGSSLALTGCDLVLGLDKYSKGPGTGGAGGGASTTSSSSSDSASGSGTTSTGSSSSTGTFCEPNSTADCYTGVPATTENVGDCRGGTTTCDPNGTAYGMCVGEVTPAAFDDYPKKGDENCDGSPTSDTLWAQQYGDTNFQSPSDLAVDSMGNTFITGTFAGSIKFGGTTLIATGNDGYLAKIAPTGDPIWALQFGSAMNQSGSSVAVDSMDNVVVTGSSQSTIAFGSTNLAAGIFVTKWNASGTLVWARGCGGSGGNAIDVDADDNVIMAGGFGMTVNCGTALTGSGSNIVLAKWTPAGAHVWSKAFAIGGGGGVRVIKSDTNKNIWIGGDLAGTVNFGGAALNGGLASAFLAKFNSSGAHIFSNNYQNGVLQDLALDSFGGPVAVLWKNQAVSGSYNVGGLNLNGIGLAKFDSAGNHVWSQSLGNAALPNMSVTLDAADGGWVAGSSQGSMNFDGMMFLSTGGRDGYLWHFDKQGKGVYLKQYPAVEMDVRALGSDPAGDLLLTGYFLGELDVGRATPLSNGSSADVVLLKVAH